MLVDLTTNFSFHFTRLVFEKFAKMEAMATEIYHKTFFKIFDMI